MYLHHRVLELQFMYHFGVVFFYLHFVCVCVCVCVCVYVCVVCIPVYIYIVGLYPTDINLMFSTILKHISGFLDLSLFFKGLRFC